jgi:hypothetical protein
MHRGDDEAATGSARLPAQVENLIARYVLPGVA